MALTARNRVPAVDVLKIDYEFVDIDFYTVGAVNDLGEPSRTLTSRAVNVRCSLDPLIRMPTFINQAGTRQTLEQGIVEQSSFYIVMSADQAVETGDIITNYDGDTFDVLYKAQWHTHLEIFVRKITK